MIVKREHGQARTHLVKFGGGQNTFFGWKDMFLLYVHSKNILGTTKFGGGHYPQMPPTPAWLRACR